MTIALCGIKFLFEKTLRREWHFFELCRPPRENRLPVVLTVEEVATVLRLVRIAVYRFIGDLLSRDEIMLEDPGLSPFK
jgi:hypothetical protein